MTLACKICSYLKILVLAALFNCSFILPAMAEETMGKSMILREYVDQTTFNHPLWVEPLENGNYLVSRVGFRSPSVQEVNPAGDVVWSFEGVQPASAKRLPGGNTLIADSGVPGFPYVPRIIEVTPDGKVVWEYRFSSLAESPRYAERLDNGNVLVTLPFKIIEIDSKKNIVWSYGNGRPVSPGSPGYLERPVMATGLSNGRILLVDRGFYKGRVIEIDKISKQVVWQFGPVGSGVSEANVKIENGSIINASSLQNPVCAVRIPGGNTLITDLGTRRLLEVNKSGQIIRQLDWAPALQGYPVMNTWRAIPYANKLLLVITLSNSNSRILELDAEALQSSL